MSLENLKINVSEERKIAENLKELLGRRNVTLSPKENENINVAINSAINQIKIINNSIPALVNNISIIKPMPNYQEQNSNLVSISHSIGGGERTIAISKKDKEIYLKELRISEEAIKFIGKRKKTQISLENEFKKPSRYVIMSNKLFSKTAKNMIEKNYFNALKNSLIKSNMAILPSSYVSVMIFTTLLSFILGFFLTFLFTFFNLSVLFPFISLNSEIIPRVFGTIWIILLVPIITFVTLYFYPSAEMSSLKKNIDYELPFATIQMSAIAGSDIEPSNIFRIIALNKEYPYIRKEAKKLMNQINLYGYDLVTALKNVASSSPSEKWTDLLNGFSSSIRSGGDLSKYLQKKAEGLLFEYKLQREKATKSAETFMNIYISIVIAAPMLLMLVLVMISASGLGLQMTGITMAIIAVTVISLINMVFLVYLQLSQKNI